jgi:hypothetical protein
MRRYWNLIILACWAPVCFAYYAPRGGISWHFFSSGSAQLFGGPAGLHLYADFPQLQIGPVAFAVAEILRFLGPHQGVLAAEIVLTAMGVAVVDQVTRIALTVRPGLAERPVALRATILVGGAVFMAGWAGLADTFTHLDDAVALLLTALAVRAALAERPILLGLCIGLAADSKPWALVFMPLVFMLPARHWIRAVASAAATVIAAWLPFVIADPRTLTATMHFTIRNVPGSALRALGVKDPRTPSWDRSAQLLIGWTLGTASVLRGRWPAVILLGVGARVALDPADWGYYTAGILLGALLWDLLGSEKPLPLWTIISFSALNAIHLLTHDAALLGLLRLALPLAFTAVILLGPPWRRRSRGRHAAPSAASSVTRLQEAVRPSAPVFRSPSFSPAPVFSSPSASSFTPAPSFSSASSAEAAAARAARYDLGSSSPR